MRLSAAAFAVALLATSAIAQAPPPTPPPQPGWVPVVVDAAKANELDFEIQSSYRHLMQLLQKWQAEAQVEAARKATTAAPPPDGGK